MTLLTFARSSVHEGVRPALSVRKTSQGLMRSPSSLRVLIIGPLALVAVFVCVSAQAASGAAPTPPAADSPVPTPLEQAVMEHNCRVPGQPALPDDLRDICLRDQVQYLRAEFGKDLRKLPPADRRTIDRACSALRVERGRDEYIACLADRLTRLTKARGRAVPVVPSVEASRVDAPAAPSGSPEPPPDAAASATAPPVDTVTDTGGRSLAIWLGGLVVLLGSAGAWMLRTRRHAKPAFAFCRVCGELAQSGDLCATCRHEAAEAQRRAATERSETAAATTSDEARRPDGPAHGVTRTDMPAPSRSADVALSSAPEATQPTQAQALEARRREHEQAVQARIEREREEARAQEAERRRWQEAAAAAVAEDSPIDPRTVLGVAANATPDEIRAAYEQAKQKYTPELVSHLGSELQELYRTKAQAVERAYELLRH